jgi:serine/threonine-protein kinase
MADREPGLGRAIIASAITSAIVSALVTIALSEGWHLVPNEVVPLLTNLSLDNASGLCESNGLRLVHRGERHDANVAAGAIVEQRPGAGSTVPRDSEVAVIVSLGPDNVDVPDVIGQSLTSARSRITAAGLAVGTVEEVEGAGTPGLVNGTTPGPGEHAPRGTSVHISVVAAARQVAVPDVTGQRQSQARDAITAAGLSAAEQVHYSLNEDRTPSTVLSTDPPAGTMVEPGSIVSLTINGGGGGGQHVVSQTF